MKDVFISYKSEEYREASRVKKALESSGFSCWMAPDDIPGGSSYAAEILQAIRGSRIFVLILSKKAQQSTHVAKELDIAINAGKTVLPFMLDNCALKDDFYYYLSNVQCYHAYESYQKALDKMIAEIRAELVPTAQSGAHATAKPQAEKQPKPQRAPKPKKEKAPKVKKEKKPQKERRTTKSFWIAIPICITLLIAFVFVLVRATTVEICGEKYNIRMNSFVSVNDVAVTGEDVKNILKLKELSAVCFVNCTFEGDSLRTLEETVLPRCTAVALRNCGVTDEDVDAMRLNRGLSSLTLSFNQITHLPDASVLARLTSLDISSTKIEDISALKQAKKLEEFRASACKLKGVGALEYATKLKVVDVSDNELLSLNGLANALELEELYAGNCALFNLKGIVNATQLEIVDVSRNSLGNSDMTILAKSAEHLKELAIYSNPISSPKILKDCKKMKVLYMDGCPIKSLKGVENMKSLEKLSAQGCGITDITPLKNCPKLQTVNLAYNQITDISALRFEGDSVRSLDFRDNQLTSVSKLPAVSYSKLVFTGNAITKYGSLAALDFDSLYIDYDAATDYTAFGREGAGKLYLRETPPDKQVQTREQVGEYSVEYVNDNDMNEIYIVA